jgi:hypothetical protein
MTLLEIFSILLIHWVADFVFQTHNQAIGKSKNWNALLAHTSTYSLVWMIPAALVIGKMAIVFVGITFIAHTITDYFTSRWVKISFDKQDFHNGFVKIGLDQILHYIQLFLTYYLLKNG